MEKYKLGEMEQKFADIIWENAPVTTRKLTEICQNEFEWKRTTTYTMLKRLCQREIFKNDNGTVVVLINKEDFVCEQGKLFIDESFGGSLPKFLVAFTRKAKLSKEEIAKLRELIDSHEEE